MKSFICFWGWYAFTIFSKQFNNFYQNVQSEFPSIVFISLKTRSLVCLEEFEKPFIILDVVKHDIKPGPEGKLPLWLLSDKLLAEISRLLQYVKSISNNWVVE